MTSNQWSDAADILDIIIGSFGTAIDRDELENVDSRFRTAVRSNRGARINGLLRGAMVRHALTKFPRVTSMSQKIREVVPPFWIFATAMSTQATAEERREHAAGHVIDRLGTAENFTTPEVRRLYREAMFYVQYEFFPDRTLGEFFQAIASKCSIHTDVAGHFISGVSTGPELLDLTFSDQNLDYFGL